LCDNLFEYSSDDKTVYAAADGQRAEGLSPQSMEGGPRPRSQQGLIGVDWDSMFINIE
jgi:hypothetical protein